MTAYLPKIATQRKPILLVDGFAGAGEFKDGTAGSPLLMWSAMSAASLPVPCRLIAIEQDFELRERLSALFVGKAEVEVRGGSFLDHADEIASLARSHSVFMYLDPFTVSGIDMQGLARILRMVTVGHSVELLLNFNAAIFVRWARAALLREGSKDPEESGLRSSETEGLNRIVGGEWWREAVSERHQFERSVDLVIEGYCGQLRRMFSEVCSQAMFGSSDHTIPKYALVFASRHPDALVLMNDEMVKSARNLIEQESAEEMPLFESTLPPVSADASRLRDEIVQMARSPIQRGQLIHGLVRAHFGEYLRKEIRGEIEALLNDGRLKSETGRQKIRNDELVWAIKYQ